MMFFISGRALATCDECGVPLPFDIAAPGSKFYCSRCAEKVMTRLQAAATSDPLKTPPVSQGEGDRKDGGKP